MYVAEAWSTAGTALTPTWSDSSVRGHLPSPGMGDSWEDEETEKIVLQPKSTGLNAKAASFSFNPGASSWSPHGATPAAPATQPSQPATQYAADTAMAEASRENGVEAGGDAHMHDASGDLFALYNSETYHLQVFVDDTHALRLG